MDPVISPVSTGGGGQSPAPEPSHPGAAAAPPVAPKPRVDSIEISVAAQAALQQAAQNQAPPPKVAVERPQGDLQIRYNQDLGVLQAKVIDPMTRQVIREIPPDDVLRMANHIRTYFRERTRKVSSPAASSGLTGSEG